MSQTPAGWYVDAQGTTRWWDGTQWTEHTQPAQPPAAPATPPAPVQPEEPAGSGPAGSPETHVEEADDRTRVRPAFRPPAEDAGSGEPAVSMEKPATPSDQPAAPVDDSPTYVGAVPPPPPSPWGAPAATPTGTPSATPPGAPFGAPPGPPPGAAFGAPPWQPGAPRSGGIKPWMLIVAGGVVLAIIAVIVLLLVFSGGGGKDASGAPKDASVSDFCDSMDWLTQLDSKPSESQFEGWQDDMSKVGTPSSMPDDARSVWEKFVAADSVDDVDSLDEDDLQSLFSYYSQNCF